MRLKDDSKKLCMSQPSLKVNLPQRSGDVQLAGWNQPGSGDRPRKKKKKKKKRRRKTKATRWMGDENYHWLRKKTAGQDPDLVNPGPNYLFFANPRFNSHRATRDARFATLRSDLCAVGIARIIAMINYVIRTTATFSSRCVTYIVSTRNWR